MQVQLELCSMEPDTYLSAVCDAPPEALTLTQKETLQRAVAKIVALGGQVGVSAEQMIDLLELGLTIGELLDYLRARSVQAV